MDSVRLEFDGTWDVEGDLLFVMDDELGIVYANGLIEYYDSNKNEWLQSPWTRDLVLDYHLMFGDLVEFISTV